MRKTSSPPHSFFESLEDGDQVWSAVYLGDTDLQMEIDSTFCLQLIILF